MKKGIARNIKKALAANRVAQPGQPAAPNQAAMAAAARRTLGEKPLPRFGNLKNLIGIKPKMPAAPQGPSNPLGQAQPLQASQPSPAQSPQSPSVPFKESIVQQPEPAQPEPMQPETPATPTPSAPTEPRQLGAAPQAPGNPPQPLQTSQPAPAQPVAPKGMAIGPAQQIQQNKAQMYQTEPGPAKSQAELEEKKKQMGQV